MIRLILILLFLLLFFILTIPAVIVLLILRRTNPKAMARGSKAIVSWAFRVMLFLGGVKRTVIGEENIPKDEAVLYIANHRIIIDVPVTYISLPNPTSYIGKIELSKVPFLNIWMKLIQSLFIDRNDIRQGLKTILEGIELVKNGQSVFIAPEGTRNQNKEMLPFKEGSFKIAEKTSCPIVPISITNTDAILENQFPRIKSSHVIVEFGKPIYIKDLEKEERKFLGAHVQGVIKETLDKNYKLI